MRVAILVLSFCCTVAAAPAPPRILSASVAPSVVRGGDTLHWNVRTTTDVVAVDARALWLSIPFKRRAPGWFETSFHVPPGVPAFFRRTYSIEIVATGQRGEKTHAFVSVRLDS